MGIFNTLIMGIVGISCLMVSIPFLFIWRDGRYKLRLTLIYLISALLLFILIDKGFTCLYENGCGNGNVAILFMPITLLFYAFGLYGIYQLLKNTYVEKRLWKISIGISSILFISSFIGEYFYTIAHLKKLGIYDSKEFFVKTIIEAGYFNQYLNAIHFNHFVWSIGLFGIILLCSLLKVKEKQDVYITNSIKR